ncbi:hypothetical protein G9A89_004160 [Geosiphon pyriformis]|nr:hypothetical protein G9A89_004160 [Geosiphon pyriformis]
MGSAKCAKCGNLGHISLGCSVGGKPSPANVVGGSSFSPLPVRDDSAFSGFSSGIKPSPLVSVELNNRFATFERSLASLAECVDKLAKRLDSPGPTVSQSSPKCQPLVTLLSQNQGADIVISKHSGVATGGETIVEVAVFDPLVVSKIEKTLHNLSVTVIGLLAKIDNAGLVPNDRAGLKNCNMQCLWPWIMNKFNRVRIFSSGLDNVFLSAGVMIIMNNSLACHVSKVEKVPGRLLSVRLFFKNKLSVVILGLYADASTKTRFGQACEINSLIAKAANFSMFMVLGGDFNKNGSKKSASLKFCSDLGLVNFFSGHPLAKAFTWGNFRSVVKVINYIFVSKSLSSALAGHEISSVSDFFDTDHNAVLVSVGLDSFLDFCLNSECKQANKDKWKFKIKDADANKWLHFRECSLDRFLGNIVLFNDAKVNGDLDAMWRILKDVVIYSADKVLDATRFLKVWFNLDSKRASKVCTMFDDNVSRMSILQHLLRVKKLYHKSKYYKSKGLMIKSILDWQFKKVVLDHLILDDKLILEPKEVKSAVDNIIEGWTRKKVALVFLPVCWSNQYVLLDHVNDDAQVQIIGDNLKINSVTGGSTTSRKREFTANKYQQHYRKETKNLRKNKFKVVTTSDTTTLEYYQSIYTHCKQRFNIPDGIEVVKKSVYQYIENCINNYLFGNYNISEVKNNLYNNLVYYSQLGTEDLNSETLATYFHKLNFNIIKYCKETYPVQSQYTIDFELETETSNKGKNKLKQYSRTTPNTPTLPKTTDKHLQTPEQGTTENQSEHSETAANEENNSEITEKESIDSENEENEMTTYIAKISDFNGEDIETSPQEWLDQVTKAGDTNGWNATRMLRTIPYFLKGTAGEWFENLAAPFNDWNAFKAAFFEQFTDNNTFITLRNRFRNIKQEPSESVMTYIGKFNKLLRQIRQLETNDYYSDAQILDQFIAGLKDKLIKKVRPHAPEDLNSAIQHAKRYEMAMEEANCTKLVNLAIGETSLAAEKKIDQLTKKIKNYFTNQQQQRYQPPQRQNQNNFALLSNNQPQNCHYCGISGHWKSDCRKLQ